MSVTLCNEESAILVYLYFNDRPLSTSSLERPLMIAVNLLYQNNKWTLGLCMVHLYCNPVHVFKCWRGWMQLWF